MAGEPKEVEEGPALVVWCRALGRQQRLCRVHSGAHARAGALPPPAATDTVAAAAAAAVAPPTVARPLLGSRERSLRVLDTTGMSTSSGGGGGGSCGGSFGGDTLRLPAGLPIRGLCSGVIHDAVLGQVRRADCFLP